jgi:hypothetical protein
MRALRVVPVLLAFVFAAACGGGGDGAAAPTTRATTTTSIVVLPLVTTTTAAPNVVTERGLGRLQLDMTLDEAKATRSIGPTHPGCELGGPGEFVAALRTGVEGTVYFNDGVLTAIVVRAGAATAAGVGPGSTLQEIKSVYALGYDVAVDHGTDETFGATFVSVKRSGRDLFGFDVDTATQRARSLAIPSLRTCE